MSHHPTEPTSSNHQPALPSDPREIMLMFSNFHARLQELADQNQQLQDSVVHLGAQNDAL